MTLTTRLRGPTLVLALTALVACAKRGAPTSTLNSAPAAAPTASPALTVPLASAPAHSPDPVTAPSLVATNGPRPTNEASPSNVSFKTSAEGCLAAASESDMARFPAHTRAAPSGVELESEAGGLRVTHRFGHACCLKSETRVEREAGLLKLTERLHGAACRCRCSSALSTWIKLESGDAELSVQLDDGARSNEVYRGPLLESSARAHDLKPPPRIQGKAKTK